MILNYSPKIFKGWNRTPPKVKNPMMVCKTDLPTPTNEAVTAEQTEAQRNWEKVRMQPDSTSVTKTDMKPSSANKKTKKFVKTQRLTILHLTFS